MKYLAAFALASLKTAKPSKDDVAAILKALNTPVAQDELDFVFESINGRDVNTLIREGGLKLAASAVAAAPAGAAPAAAAPAAGAAPAAAAKAPAKVEEEEDDGMFGLFD